MRELKRVTTDRQAIEKLEKADTELAKVMHESVSLGAIYKEILKDWHFVLIAVVVPPVVIYGVLYALVMCINWIVRGFKTLS